MMTIFSHSANLSRTLAELGGGTDRYVPVTTGDRLFFDSIDTDPAFEIIVYSLIDPSR